MRPDPARRGRCGTPRGGTKSSGNRFWPLPSACRSPRRSAASWWLGSRRAPLAAWGHRRRCRGCCHSVHVRRARRRFVAVTDNRSAHVLAERRDRRTGYGSGNRGHRLVRHPGAALDPAVRLEVPLARTRVGRSRRAWRSDGDTGHRVLGSPRTLRTDLCDEAKRLQEPGHLAHCVLGCGVVQEHHRDQNLTGPSWARSRLRPLRPHHLGDLVSTQQIVDRDLLVGWHLVAIELCDNGV